MKINHWPWPKALFPSRPCQVSAEIGWTKNCRAGTPVLEPKMECELMDPRANTGTMDPEQTQARWTVTQPHQNLAREDYVRR